MLMDQNFCFSPQLFYLLSGYRIFFSHGTVGKFSGAFSAFGTTFFYFAFTNQIPHIFLIACMSLHPLIL